MNSYLILIFFIYFFYLLKGGIMDKFYFPDDYESPQSIIDTQKLLRM